MCTRARSGPPVDAARTVRAGAILLAGLAVLPALASGCASTGEHRPFVAGSATKLADLYLYGELTDQHGNRWNVWLLPGVVPPVESAGDMWELSGELLEDLGKGSFWSDRGRDVGDGVEFAFEDSLADFMLQGIADDYGDTAADLAELARETPFGWIPRMGLSSLWGFVLKPVGRVAGGLIGFVGGLGYAVGAPVAQVAARPVGSVVVAVGGGVVAPVGVIVAHQPLYLFAIMNREPALRHDGSFGLEIIEYAPGAAGDGEAAADEIDWAAPAGPDPDPPFSLPVTEARRRPESLDPARRRVH